MNRLRKSARLAYWCARHPLHLRGLAHGASLKDLILREDLRAIGLDLSFRESRILGCAHLNVEVVAKLRDRFGRMAPRTVLDVGAQHGQFALAASLAIPGCRVISFEPMASSFGNLQRVAAARPGIAAFPFALGSTDGAAVLRRSANAGSSSLLPMRDQHVRLFPGSQSSGEESIRVRRLDGLVESGAVRIERPALLKIDTQGYEDRVLAGAGRALDQVDAVVIELSLVPLYEGQVLAGPIRALLEAAGFQAEADFDRISSPVTGEVCQVDGVFLRRR